MHAQASDGHWTVVEVSGAARVTENFLTPKLVSARHVLAPGATLTTGGDGRITLVRGDQEIVVGPNTRMALPAQETQGLTRILQDMGTMLYKVDKKPNKHFKVETPYLAAVVKGTMFTVTANADIHAVHVSEGLVEVSTPNGNMTGMVEAGSSARVSTKRPDRLQIDTPGAGPTQRSGKTPGSAPAPSGFADDLERADLSNDIDTPSITAEASPADFEFELEDSGRGFVIETEIDSGPLNMAELTDGLVQGPEGLSENQLGDIDDLRDSDDDFDADDNGNGNDDDISGSGGFTTSTASAGASAGDGAAVSSISSAVSNIATTIASNPNTGGNGNGNGNPGNDLDLDLDDLDDMDDIDDDGPEVEDD